MSQLFVTEIFTSIQGESHWSGYPCTFIRLGGCNLDCNYCDTRYSRQGGEETTPEAAAKKALAFGVEMVEVTGGEPLHQPSAFELLELLVEGGARVLLETNGSYSIYGLPPEVTVVMDIKTPGSGMAESNLWSNIGLLRPSDEVKFILTSRADYEWSKEVIEDKELVGRTLISLSPAYGLVDPAELAAWMVEDRLDVRFQLQLHRIIWPERDRGV